LDRRSPSPSRLFSKNFMAGQNLIGRAARRLVPRSSRKNLRPTPFGMLYLQ
jgi:hypothetical protein